MSQPVDTLLTERRRMQMGLGTGPRFVLSLLLHGGLLTAFIAGPLLLAPEARPPEFVAVQIVPAQALGVPDPAPAPVERRAEPEPEPAPKPPPPEPEPARPVLPSPEPERSRPKARTTAPAPAPARPTQVDPGPARRAGSARGSSLGTSQFGATVGSFDNPDFVYSYYVDRMLAMIHSEWRRPTLGGEVEATLHYRIDRDGQISDLRVARSSGYNSFDLAALRAVQRAAPFPRLPQTYRHDSLGVNLVVR